MKNAEKYKEHLPLEEMRNLLKALRNLQGIIESF